MSTFQKVFGEVDSIDSFIANLRDILQCSASAQSFLSNENLYNDLRFVTKRLGSKTWIKDLVGAVADWEEHQHFPSLEEVSDNEIVLTNLGFLFPKHFRLLELSKFKAVSSLGFTGACKILLNPRSAEFLLDSVRVRPEFVSVLSPGLRMAIAFSLAYYQHVEEDVILASLSSNIPAHQTEQDTIVINAINGRIRSLKRRDVSARELHGGKTALFITGQLRGPLSTLSEIRSKFSLPNVDVFVSTWKRPGRIKIDRVRASRVFTPEATRMALTMSDRELAQVDRLVEDFRRAEPVELKRQIANELSISDLSCINVQDEEEGIFKAFTNHEKMYFHNAYWPLTFGNGWLSSNYDYAIKVRPDLRLESKGPLTIEDLRSTQGIATESNGWKFEGWGLGIGDQIMYGRANAMEPLMSVWHSRSQSSIIRTSGLGRPWGLLGHSSVGIELWLSGDSPVQMKFKHRGYIGDPLIDVDELSQLVRALD